MPQALEHRPPLVRVLLRFWEPLTSGLSDAHRWHCAAAMIAVQLHHTAMSRHQPWGHCCRRLIYRI
jgi:hypothetical protein